MSKTQCTVVLLVAVAMLVPVVSARAAEEPIEIGTEKQLFVDDYLIDSKKQVFRIINQPEKYEHNPVIRLEPPQEVHGDQLVVVSGSVMYDEQDELFKMWYEGANYDWSHNVVGYATSTDGYHWNLPNLGLIEYNGSKDNNIVFHRGEGEMAPGVFKDPVAKDPDRKYKMIYDRGRGVGVAFSPDGIHWTKGPDEDVIPTSDSPNSVMWDPNLGRYVAHTRHNQRVPQGFSQRQVLQSESGNFIDWERIGVIMKASPDDPPWRQQYYNMEFMPYEGVYFGFISVYQVLPGMQPKITPGIPWLDRMNVELAYSRDGRNWHSFEHPQIFIPYSPEPEAFDHSLIYTMQHPIVKDDEIWIYYVGFEGKHWFLHRDEIQGGAVGLAKLRLDGFVSMDAGEGQLTTKPFIMDGDELVVNANASKGSLKVEILNEDGEPIQNYHATEGYTMTTDEIRHVAGWEPSSSVSELRGKPIRLRFHMDRCKLYSFTFRQRGE